MRETTMIVMYEQMLRSDGNIPDSFDDFCSLYPPLFVTTPLLDAHSLLSADGFKS